MANWKIEYWKDSSGKSPVKEWFSKLNRQEAKSVFDDLEMLKLYGNQLKMPYSKALSKGLFELRERTYHYRIYYSFNGKEIIIVLVAGNKKSQEKDILLARKRLANL